MSARIAVQVPRERIAEFCRRNRIQKLSLFGSVLRDDFDPESDVDVLVEFEPGHTPGLDYFRMQDNTSRPFLARRRRMSRKLCEKSIPRFLGVPS